MTPQDTIEQLALLREIRDLLVLIAPKPKPAALPIDMSQTLLTIIEHVAAEYNFEPAAIRRLHSIRRYDKIVWPRHVACYFCRTLTNASLNEIGALFNGYDHGSVGHGVQAVKDRISYDPQIRADIERIGNDLADILQIAVEHKTGFPGPTLTSLESDRRQRFPHKTTISHPRSSAKSAVKNSAIRNPQSAIEGGATRA